MNGFGYVDDFPNPAVTLLIVTDIHSSNASYFNQRTTCHSMFVADALVTPKFPFSKTSANSIVDSSSRHFATVDIHSNWTAMSLVPGAADDIAKIDPNERCYEGASREDQLKFRNGGKGWAVLSPKTLNYVHVGAAATIAMGLTECCAEYGRGKVSTFPSLLSCTKFERRLGINIDDTTPCVSSAC